MPTVKDKAQTYTSEQRGNSLPLVLPQDRQAKVLTINFGGIGDEILFLPTLKSIRNLMPGSEITLLLEPRSQSVKQISNLIDKTVTFDIKQRPLYPADLSQLLMLLCERGYDVVLSSGSSKFVSCLLFLSGINVRVGYDSGKHSHWLLTAPVKLNLQQYAGKMYHDLATGLAAPYLPEEECIPQIDVPATNAAAMSELVNDALAGASLNRASTRLVLIHPGTSRLAVEKGIIKTWDIDNWIGFIKLMSTKKDVRVILCGGPDDTEIVKAISESVPPDAGLISMVGKTKSLADLAGLIKACDLIVCVDSAPMHVAVGLNQKLVALFGPTEVSKLLPSHRRFKALSDASSSVPRQLQDGLGVRLHPDIVYRAALDQLKV